MCVCSQWHSSKLCSNRRMQSWAVLEPCSIMFPQLKARAPVAARDIQSPIPDGRSSPHASDLLAPFLPETFLAQSNIQTARAIHPSREDIMHIGPIFALINPTRLRIMFSLIAPEQVMKTKKQTNKQTQRNVHRAEPDIILPRTVRQCGLHRPAVLICFDDRFFCLCCEWIDS